jgi:SNF2 family DNA or RNA helicase
MILKPHQITGAQYLAARRRALLTDPPGMMKTLTVAHAFKLVQDQAPAQGRAPLIICPAIVRSHWKRTFAEHLPDTPVWVKSYDEIVRGGERLRDELLDLCDSIHLDEFHFLKHATAKRTRLILGKGGYVPSMPLAWGTSGTPLDKNPTNIWTILSTFFPHLAVAYGVPTFAKFVERYAVWTMRERHGKRYVHYFPETKSSEEFATLLAHMWLRRESLPGTPVLWSTIRLDASTASDYTTQSPALAEALKYATDIESLAAIRTDPETSRAMRRLGEHKAPAVAALLRAELEDTDEKVVLFAHHHSVLHRLREELQEFGVAYIDGTVPPSVREIEIQRFATQANVRVFIGQDQACGTGLDGLQHSGARRMLIVEPVWSKVLLDQLAARLARHGQQHETVAAQLVALSGTLDEGVMRLNQREGELLTGVGL